MTVIDQTENCHDGATVVKKKGSAGNKPSLIVAMAGNPNTGTGEGGASICIRHHT